jgi:hypothetical protein
MVIERIFLWRAYDAFFKFIAILQQWHPLARQWDHDRPGRLLDVLNVTGRRLATPASP